MKPKQKATIAARPSYTSAYAACARYFLLREGLGAAGSKPMNPDDVIQGTRMSGDNPTLLELLDLARALHKAGVVEGEPSWHLLCVEFTRPDLPIAGAPGGRNKLALLRESGTRITETEYLVRLSAVMRDVREELESRRWVPRTPKQSPSYPRTAPSPRSR